MRRVLPVLLFTMVALICVPQPAHAQRAWMEWLERLSGPGPFQGGGLELTVYCRNEPSGKQRWLRCPNAVEDAEPVKRRALFNLGLAKGATGTNPTVPSTVSSPVRFVAVAPAVDVEIDRALDVGVGLTVLHFYGPLFDGFTTLVVQPVRVTVRPLMTFGSDARWGALSVRLTANAFGQLDQDDFGGTVAYKSGYELVWAASVGVDVGVLVWGRR